MFTHKEYVAVIELRNEGWDFYILGAWRDKDGFYISTDSGCSCPAFWENHTEEDLTGPLTYMQVKTEATSLWKDAGQRVPKSHLDEFLKDLRDSKRKKLKS